MLNIREIHPLGSGRWIFFCDMFNDDIITDMLSVDGEIFEKDMFQVEIPKACFSNPQTRNIVLSTRKDCQNVSSIAFA